MVKVVVLKLKVSGKKFQNRDAEKLRGYIGNLFKEEILYHNHVDKYTFNYQSAQIFYKVLDGDLAIVGVNMGAEIILKNYEKIEKIRIEEEFFSVEKELNEVEIDLKVEDKRNYSYHFITPWFALNQENYKKYRSGEFDLNNQLRNNIIEFFKLCGVWADKKIDVKAKLKEMIITQKNTKILAFVGEFKTNVNLPNHIGLGKRKSIGYGGIEKIEMNG